MSSTHSFKTMPAPGHRSYPERIAIVGDLGLTDNTTTTVDHVRSNQPELIVLAGDISYANLYLTNGTGADCYSCSFSDSPIHETYQPHWDYWGRYMEPVVSEIPIMVIEGNHEIELQAKNKTFVSYSSRFAFPSEESGSNSEFYYSFNARGIHFVMLGAYTFYNKSVDYLLFIVHDANLHSNPDEVTDVKYVNRDQLKEILISKKQQKVKANQAGAAAVGTSDAHSNIHMHVANYMHRVSDMDFTTAWEQNDMALIQYWLLVHHKNNHKRIRCL